MNYLNNNNLTGKLVELYGDEGLWYRVDSDNGDRVEVVCVNTNLPLPPREIVSKRFILQVK